MIVASLLTTIASARSLRAKAGLPQFNQALGWIILCEWAVSIALIRLTLVVDSDRLRVSLRV